ncbi:hypothetical protein [Spirilliplanes yamanashiensis]|uniref:Uncharacterized protein n=1 Tax=Spirilliplanes yamanashiensis TaxID=42233 RepID=A0A8J3YD94_9ACTN|nr:hypothetical protein [Spirilliplanes yamanashiensis]MDP9816432.1 hypothetical protein [Spirilliplanes yamanashiensis]GIJ05959.1 hypothetical protein Sya03_53110 [Spirilliplanes yamanashiensis]
MPDGRPTRLGGLHALLVGGTLLALLLGWLDPVTDQRDCPNWGASGNASAFADPRWDLGLPLLSLGWILAVAAEQALPATWQHRTGVAVATRATLAVTAAILAACCLNLPPAIACR